MRASALLLILAFCSGFGALSQEELKEVVSRSERAELQRFSDEFTSAQTKQKWKKSLSISQFAKLASAAVLIKMASKKIQCTSTAKKISARVKKGAGFLIGTGALAWWGLTQKKILSTFEDPEEAWVKQIDESKRYQNVSKVYLAAIQRSLENSELPNLKSASRIEIRFDDAELAFNGIPTRLWIKENRFSPVFKFENGMLSSFYWQLD